MNLTRRLWLWGGGLALIVALLALPLWLGYELRDRAVERDEARAGWAAAVVARDTLTVVVTTARDSLLQLEQQLAAARDTLATHTARVRRVVADPTSTRADVAGVALALADAADTLATRTLAVGALVPLVTLPELPAVVLPPAPTPAALVDAERRGWWRGLGTGLLGGALGALALALAL